MECKVLLESLLDMVDLNEKRCFGDQDPLYRCYHDEEWGKPVHDEHHLFEMLSLEGAQAGLNWLLILKRRESYRQAFHQFDPSKVSQMSDEELEAILVDGGVIRNRRKIWSVRQNARVFLEIQKEFGSFDRYVWAFVDFQPIRGEWKSIEEVPCFSSVSDYLAQDLKKRGMSFVGTKIIYSFMQACGLVDDHLISCWVRQKKV